jgi:hypothetical protein
VSFGLVQEAIRAAENDPGTRLLALIEHEEAILLQRDDEGAVTLPSATRIGDAEDRGSLLNKVKAAGVDAELSFLFAVYEEQESGAHSIVYRGEARAADARAKASLVPFRDIPWDDIHDSALRSMIERYVREREENSFGVYVGDTTSGRVQPLAKGD